MMTGGSTVSCLPFLVAVAAILLPAAAQAQNRLDIGGQVIADCGIRLDPIKTVFDVTAGETAKAAAFSVSCNSFDGFSLTVSSANAGKFVSEGGTQGLDYSFGLALGGDSASQALSSPLMQEWKAPLTANDPRSSGVMSVTVPGSGKRAKGMYIDTVTITIAAR
jgi:hypothetical protein